MLGTGYGDKILFELGSLECYERELLTNAGIIVKGVFWRDRKSPQGYGPFVDQYSAMKHYTETLKTFSDASAASDQGTAGKLISVDFKSKRRLT